MESYIAYGDKLKGEYKDAFETVSTYMGTVMVDEVTESEYLNELLDSFLSAQEEGKPVSDIVGNDIETFCKNFCSDFSFKERLYRIWDFLKSMMLVIFWLSLGDMFLSGDDIFTAKSETNLSAYIICILITVFITVIMNAILSRVIFKSKKRGYKIVNIISGIVAVICLVFFVWLFNADYLSFIDIPAYIPTIISEIFLVVYYVLNRQRRQKSKLNKVSLLDSVSEMNNQEFAQAMEKKRLKKHLEPEEFLRREIRETQRTEKINKYSWIIGVVMYIGSLIGTWSQMESLFDGLLYMVILGVVLYFADKYFDKASQTVIEERKKWAEEYQKTLQQETLDNKDVENI